MQLFLLPITHVWYSASPRVGREREARSLHPLGMKEWLCRGTGRATGGHPCCTQDRGRGSRVSEWTRVVERLSRGLGLNSTALPTAVAPADASPLSPEVAATVTVCAPWEPTVLVVAERHCSGLGVTLCPGVSCSFSFCHCDCWALQSVTAGPGVQCAVALSLGLWRSGASRSCHWGPISPAPCALQCWPPS